MLHKLSIFPEHASLCLHHALDKFMSQGSNFSNIVLQVDCKKMIFVQDRFLFDDTTRASVSAFVTLVQSHPRFRLRCIAILAASCGCCFNFLTLFLTLFGFRDGDLAILTGCAYIPVSMFKTPAKEASLINDVAVTLDHLAPY